MTDYNKCCSLHFYCSLYIAVGRSHSEALISPESRQRVPLARSGWMRMTQAPYGGACSCVSSDIATCCSLERHEALYQEDGQEGSSATRNPAHGQCPARRRRLLSFLISLACCCGSGVQTQACARDQLCRLVGPCS